MRVYSLPKSWLIHSITYEGYTGGIDDWGNPSYDAPITISNVRLDPSTVFSRDNQQTTIVANAVIFVDTTNSLPIPDFKEQSLIEFEGESYVIQKVVPCYYPEQNAVRHYELEVF